MILFSVMLSKGCGLTLGQCGLTLGHFIYIFTTALLSMGIAWFHIGVIVAV